MLGTILFCIIAVIVFIATFYGLFLKDREKYCKPSLGQKLEGMFYVFLSVIPVAFVWMLIVVLPVACGTGFINPEQRYEEIQAKISWVENGQVEASMDDYSQLHEDIADYDSYVCFGKENYGNVWNGMFIDDAFLVAKEIPMPEWLQRSTN